MAVYRTNEVNTIIESVLDHAGEERGKIAQDCLRNPYSPKVTFVRSSTPQNGAQSEGSAGRRRGCDDDFKRHLKILRAVPVRVQLDAARHGDFLAHPRLCALRAHCADDDFRAARRPKL